MTPKTVDWPTGYVCLIPYQNPHPNDTHAGRADFSTFSYERRGAITKAVKEWSEFAGYEVPWEWDVTDWKLEHQHEETRRRVWTRLYNLGFRVIPCTLAAKG